MSRGMDRGASAIVIAFSLLLLLGIAAVALDLARGWNERRQDQTSVDVAAVAGALSFGGDTNDIADEVMDAARSNLDTTYSDAEWDSLWTACIGPPPTGFIPASSSIGTIDCIGLNPSFLWVRLPEQITDTTFGRVLGVDSLSTDADVIVTLVGEGFSGALPFAIGGDAAAGEICLDTGPSTPPEPCESNQSGSFGNIGPPLFGNEQMGTTPSCGGAIHTRVADAAAMGIDHPIWAFSSTAWSASGWDPGDNPSNNTITSNPETHLDECNDTGGFVAEPADGVPINTAWVDTGNNTKAEVEEGLMTGSSFADGGPARLQRSTVTRDVESYDLDNVALWEYLLPESTHSVSGCDGPTIRGLLTIDEKNDAMRACLEGYSGGSVIFSDSIVDNPRLGLAPRLWHNFLGSGTSARPIKRFDVVFIHGLFLKGSSTDLWFYPDEDTTPIDVGNFQQLDLTSAYLLTDSMVSDFVHTALGGFTNDTWQPEIYE